MNSFEDRVNLLRADSDRFLRYLKGLPDEARTRQSACDLWRVDDVVAHLVGNAEFYAATVERGLKGEYEPPEGRPTAGTGHPSLGAAGTAEGAIANRERLGGKLLAALEDRTNHLTQLLAGLSPEDQDKPCYHPGGIVPAGNFVDLRFKELALHEWDIRSALEPEAQLSPESLPSIIILITESYASGSLRIVKKMLGRSVFAGYFIVCEFSASLISAACFSTNSVSCCLFSTHDQHLLKYGVHSTTLAARSPHLGWLGQSRRVTILMRATCLIKRTRFWHAFVDPSRSPSQPGRRIT